eukprot:4293942-Pyramimonas_sp.AAC.1
MSGREVSVKWDDGKFYKGTVTHYNQKKGVYTIIYQDGDKEYINLNEVMAAIPVSTLANLMLHLPKPALAGLNPLADPTPHPRTQARTRGAEPADPTLHPQTLCYTRGLNASPADQTLHPWT